MAEHGPFKFWQELKRRNVFRVASVYTITSWLIVEITSTAFPLLNIPVWVASTVLVLLLIGFPIAVILAWAFEMSPDGFIRTESAASKENPLPDHKKKPFTGKVWVGILIALLTTQYFYLKSDSNFQFIDSPVGKSIAVIPFKNLSKDEDNQYFADGVMESILNHLAKVNDIRVISRTTMETFRNTDLTLPEIAAKLNVTHILEGSVQKSGQQVSVTAQLIETHTDKHLWSENYVRELKDIFDLQASLAIKIAAELKSRLSPELERVIKLIPTKNQQAYDYYLQAISRSKYEQYKQAIKLFSEAIVLDPNFILAYLGRADASRNLYFNTGEVNDSLATLTRNDFRSAILINPELPETIMESAYQLYHMERDFPAAITRFKQAQQLMPGQPLVYAGLHYVYRRMGDFKQALVYAKKAVQLDPLSYEIIRNTANTYRINQEYANALDILKNFSSSDPTKNFSLHMFWIHIEWKGDVYDAYKPFG